MKHKVSELSGAQLDYAYALTENFEQPPRLRDGVCEVYDNPCGGPGPCWGWYSFCVSTVPSDPHRDVGGAFRRHGALQWKEEIGPGLADKMRSIIAGKFGDEVELP